MVSSKFIKISHYESLYGQRNLLHSELELLSSTKHLLDYKSLRIEENKLKILLKLKIKECLSMINQLDKTLPKIKISESSDSEEMQSEIEESIQEDELDAELAKIKAKLSALQMR